MEVINNIRIRDHLGLVHNMAKRLRGFCHGALEYDDLVQAGSIGLLVAAEKFDASKGFAFSTYASWWLWHLMMREIQNAGRTIRIPCHVHERARRLGIPLPPTTLHLDQPVNAGDDDRRTLLDCVGTEDDPVEAIHQRELAANVHALINTLSPRLRLLVEERWGKREATLDALGEQLASEGSKPLCRERVRQLEREAFERMRRVDRWRNGGVGQALAGEA